MLFSDTTRRVRREAVARVLKRTLVLCAAIISLCAATASASGATEYNGMLNAGVLTMGNPGVTVPAIVGDSPSGSGVVAANATFGDDSWTAPGGSQFNGFAYTAANFVSQNLDATGGLSIGFKGTGGSAPGDLNFPWTDDCSVTEAVPRSWIYDDAQVGTTSGYQADCSEAGNTSGWTFNNIEIESNAPGINPETSYATLHLIGWCARDATCQGGGGGDMAAAQIANLSANIVDPSAEPSGSAGWSGPVSSSHWYQTNTGALSLNYSASDPAGVCYLAAGLTGPGSYASTDAGGLNGAPVNPGAPVGEEFASATSPCSGAGGGAVTGSWTLPAGMANGTYDLAVAAANPGNYASQGYSGSGSPIIATYDSALNVDDTTPAANWANVPSGWTSTAAGTLDVTAGPSGIASVICSDNGADVAPTLVSGSAAGAGTTVWSVPMSDTSGANSVSCTATNGDVNGGLSGTSPATTFDVDTVVPTLDFTDPGYTAADWTNESQTVTATATGGPGGIRNVACLLDGLAAAMTPQGQVTISGNGAHTLDCTATSNTGITGEATYAVNIDTEQPTLTFLVNSSAPSSAWLSGTPVVTVIGSEDGGILSGLSRITCSVSGGASFTLSGLDAADDYTGSFELEENGTDQVSCSGTTVAGTTQATPSTVAVNVDNPNYSSKPSALIDDGGDPYSGGPSQSQWYRTPQSVTITADDTGGPAPIASIACKGAVTGNWPISNLNTDAHGGEQISVTVDAPGGDLSCTAQDAAGNVYPLGSYLFQIDDTAPTGYFVAQANWLEPDEIELHVTDNDGSGVAVVRVYGQSPTVDQGQPQLVGDAQYDAASGDYVVTIPDGVAPWVAGNWTFYANVIDVAGNQGQVTAGAQGTTEDLSLPLRDDTAVTAMAQKVAAAQEAVIPTSLAAAALPGTAPGAEIAHRATGNAVATGDAVATEAVAAVAKAKPVKAKPRRAGHVLRVSYGKAVTIAGVLKDVSRGGHPISGAKVLVYQEVSDAKTYKKLGSAMTDSKGAYRYRVKAGASRTLFVVYPGTSVLRSAASDLQEQFGGRLSVNASNIRAGGRLVISGVVEGGHIPSGGLDVTIDYRQLGAPGSGTLGTVRTDKRGRYRFTQHFETKTRGLAYQLWVVVPKQAKWPYLKASTAKLVRRVR